MWLSRLPALTPGKVTSPSQGRAALLPKELRALLHPQVACLNPWTSLAPEKGDLRAHWGLGNILSPKKEAGLR